MEPEKFTRRRYVILDLESYEARCARRLIDDLELDPDAVKVILHLGRQVRELQEQVRELEMELELRKAGRGARLARFRQVLYEAYWQEQLDE